MLNGFFGERAMRHIAHWRSVKYVDEFNEEGETEGETIIRKRERFSHELTLAYESGKSVEPKEAKGATGEKRSCAIGKAPVSPPDGKDGHKPTRLPRCIPGRRARQSSPCMGRGRGRRGRAGGCRRANR